MLSRESLFEKLLVKLDHWHEKLFGVIGHLIFGQILLKPIIWGESFHTKSNAPSFRMVLFEVSDFHRKGNINFFYFHDQILLFQPLFMNLILRHIFQVLSTPAGPYQELLLSLYT